MVSLKYSCELVFRKLQLEYNGAHLETHASNLATLWPNVSVNAITCVKAWFLRKHLGNTSDFSFKMDIEIRKFLLALKLIFND